MVKHHYQAAALHVCGHKGYHSFRTGNKAETSEEKRYAANSVCADCASKIQTWFGHDGAGFYKIELPKLVSRFPSSIGWGNRVRITQLRKFGPLMKKLEAAGESDPLGALVLQILKLMFRIEAASFWIDVEKHTYGSYSLTWDVEALIRGREASSNPLGKASVMGYWFQHSPSLIAEAKALIAASKQRLKEVIGDLDAPKAASIC
ncbi:hypothetical protein [Pseudomonas sp. LS-2]|uniref:hypothetical protein n=1 Tax=Pseudomonas sp. LS-2 TaxID=2315859 RepID=UPI001058E112|nr:hypothetical protein [Pseudomonas sp. LS-2]